jgi:bifunctional UDP-N-acetylglucosamine pyrophosphorylase / glucosamine-1-phosphate N-acetyltransferase
MTELAVVILAAGQGTRMQSDKPKILHEVGGRPMVVHVFEAARAVADRRPLLVVGPGDAGVRQLFGGQADYALQPEQLGTGHAAMMAQPQLRDWPGPVLITYADMPLLRAETMRRLAELQGESGAAVAVLTVDGEAASSFGRVIRDVRGQVAGIVEVAQARRRPDAEAVLAVRELNAGVYCFDGPWLWDNLPRLPLRQARSGQEYYLTDLVELAASQDRAVVALAVDDAEECLGAGTRAELVEVERAFRRRTNRRWLENGVTLLDPATTYIDDTVQIGQDTVIWPNTHLQGQTVIGRNCLLGPNVVVRDARIGAGCRIEQAVVERVSLADGTVVQPFTHLRPQA